MAPNNIFVFLNDLVIKQCIYERIRFISVFLKRKKIRIILFCSPLLVVLGSSPPIFVFTPSRLVSCSLQPLLPPPLHSRPPSSPPLPPWPPTRAGPAPDRVGFPVHPDPSFPTRIPHPPWPIPTSSAGGSPRSASPSRLPPRPRWRAVTTTSSR